MRTSQQTRQRPGQTQRINPRSIAAGLILQMPSEELQLRIEEEIATNPALEASWDQTCPDCGRGLANGICWVCRSAQAAAAPPEASFDLPPLPSERYARASGERPYDPVESACAPLSLQEHVLQQAHLVLANGDYRTAENLISGLSD